MVCNRPAPFLVHISDLAFRQRIHLKIQSGGLPSDMDSAKRRSEVWRLSYKDRKSINMTLEKAAQRIFSTNAVATLIELDRHRLLGFWLGRSLSSSHHLQLSGGATFYFLNPSNRSISICNFTPIYETVI